METLNVRGKIVSQIQHILDHTLITDRKFLDDEQLIKADQLAVLEEIFNANVRDAEIREISSHFAPILRGDHPVHLALWGKTGTGKTLTMSYFLNLLAEMCRKKNIPMRHEHIDLSTPRPCFRALNDLACMVNASKRYKKGISLEELMLRIEAALADYRGYLILFIDEVDNVRRDRDTFLSFLVRRLPQKIPAKLILVFVSNRLNWSDNLDPRIKSFLKLNELVFKPYDAVDLKLILEIRVQKALRREAVQPGFIEKIAALASRDHGDARRAVALLARSAYLAEKAGQNISLDLVDQAASQIEQDKYIKMIRTAPAQLQAAMGAVIQASRQTGDAVDSGQAYEAYKAFCVQADLRPLTGRAFSDLLGELDMYSLLHSQVISRGRYGRTRRIVLDLPEDVLTTIQGTIRSRFDL
jgi:archaeal cell division control protein 6